MVFSTGWWEIEQMVFSTCWWEIEQMVFSTGWWEIEQMVFSTCWWEVELVVFSTGWWEIKLGLIAQSITCLTADMCMTVDSGPWHTFVEIDHKIIFTAILLPSADLRRVVVSYKRKYVHEVLVNRLNNACPGNECG